MTWLQSIADWLSDSQDVPEAVLHAAERTTLDTLACAFGAYDHPAAQVVMRVVHSITATGDASLIGLAQRTSVLSAVLYNGTLVRALDCNDVFFARGVGGHPSDNIPVALAFAEAQHACGPDYLRAVALGYELYWRMSRLLFASTRGYEWDHVSTSGLVAAAIAGLLRRLDPATLAQALAIGGAQSYALSELRAGELSMIKAAANGIVAQNGALGALLAAEGMSGPPELLEGRRGLLSALGIEPTESVRVALAGPIARWHILDVATKPYPAIGTSQGVLAATLAIVGEHAVHPADVDRVEVRLPDLPITREHLAETSRRTPRTRDTADHSIPFLVAVALEDGAVGPGQFTDGRWLQPSTGELMSRVHVEADASLNEFTEDGFPARVTLRTRRGETWTQDMTQVPGSARRPLSDEGLIEKFNRLAGQRIPEQRRKELCQRVLNLRAERDMASLAELLRQP